jgi:hypothetical protein
VLHDRDDAEVPWQHGAGVAAAWPGAKLVLTGGLGHRRILRAPEAITATTAFLAAHVPAPRRPGVLSAAGGAWEPDETGDRAARGALVG